MKIQLPFIFALFFLASCGGDGADSGLGGGATTSAADASLPIPPSSVTCGDINVVDNSNSEQPSEPESPSDSGDSGDSNSDALQCDIANDPCIGNPAVSRSVLRAVKGFMVEHELVHFTITDIIPVSAKSTIVAGCGSTVVVDGSTTTVSPVTNLNSAQ